MQCFKPLQAYRGRNPGKTGAAPIVFRVEDSSGVSLTLPCGQCIGCRLEQSRQWATRIMHEASLSPDNCFVTLTYSEESLPHGGSLLKSDFQDFMKRLRKHWTPLRYFHCGEYGEQLSRPHYHICMFGIDWPDKVLFRRSETGDLFTSAMLTKVWGLGHAVSGALTFESAAYVARYCLKKVGETDYVRMDDYGQVYEVEPEYVTMSRARGIGRDWFELYSADVYPSDECVVRGHPSKPPRYYDKLFSEAEPSVFDEIRRSRMLAAKERAADNSPMRLRSKEICVKSRISTLKRRFENE